MREAHVPQHTNCGSRLRREPAIAMGIRHALDKLRYDNTSVKSHTMMEQESGEEKAMLIIRIDDESELRTYEERHAGVVFAVVDQNREYLREWLPWVDSNVSVEDTREFIRRGLVQQANNDGFQASIWSQGRFAGGIGFHYIDRLNSKTEIGYWLDASLQGKGLMTRACKAMTSYAFREYELNRVEIHCASDNTRSRAIPERLGFIQEGILREASWLYDHFVDDVVYGMLAREWRW